MKTKQEFIVQHLSDHDKEYLIKRDLLKNPDLNFSGNNTLCIYSKNNGHVNAYCEMAVLKGKRKLSNQSILITNIWTEEQTQIQKLISECVKYAWESGFHAAFTSFQYGAFKKVGFEPVCGFTLNLEEKPHLLGMELSWDGFKKISRDLFLSNQNLLKNYVYVSRKK